MGWMDDFYRAGEEVRRQIEASGEPFVKFGEPMDTEKIWGMTLEEVEEAPARLEAIRRRTPVWKRQKRRYLRYRILVAKHRATRAQNLGIELVLQ